MFLLAAIWPRYYFMVHLVLSHLSLLSVSFPNNHVFFFATASISCCHSKNAFVMLSLFQLYDENEFILTQPWKSDSIPLFSYLSHSSWSQISMSQNFPGYYFHRKADCNPLFVLNILSLTMVELSSWDCSGFIRDLSVVLVFDTTGQKGDTKEYPRPVLVLQFSITR